MNLVIRKKNRFCILLGVLLGMAINGNALFSESLFPTDPLEGMKSGLADHGSLVAVEGQAFTKAVRAHVADKPKNHWDVQFILKSGAAVPTGSPLSLKFYARSLGGEGHILAFLKDKAGQTVIREELKPASAWKEFSLSGTAKSAYEKGDLSLVVTFGFQTQDVEVGGLSLESGGSTEQSSVKAKPEVSPSAAKTESASVSLLGANAGETILTSLSGKGSMVNVGGKPFPNALHIHVAEKAKNYWDVQFVEKSASEVPAGSEISLSLAMRSASGEGKFMAAIKDKAGQTLFRQEWSPGAEWKDFSISVPAKAGFAKGELSLIVAFGYQAQDIEIGGLKWLVSGAGVQASAADKPVAAQAEDSFPPLPKDQRRFAIFKWDDLRSSGKAVSERFQRVADFVAEKKIHASLGIICNSLEQDNPGYSEWIRSRAVENGGPFEFWLHGYTHMMTQSNGKPNTEFSGPSYEEQKKNFSRACEVTKEKTDLTIRSFGSPGNNWDETCVKVMKEFPDVKVWLFGDPRGKSDKFLIPRLVELERAHGRPDYANFIKGYTRQRTSEALLMQGHPDMWTDEGFSEFKRVFELLVKEGWEFVTPYEYYQYKTGAK